MRSQHCATQTQTSMSRLRSLLKMRELCGVGHLIRKVQGVSPDHAAYVAAESNERLISYICGHIARKIVLNIECHKCSALLLIEKDTVMTHLKVKSANLADQRGLLYPSGTLFRFIRQLENLITSCSSTQGLHHESVTDILCLTRQKTNMQTVCLLLMKLQCAKRRRCHFPLSCELIPQSFSLYFCGMN